MADVQIAGAQGTAPQSYVVPNATEVIPRAINATFDGTGASGAFVPTVEIISDGGVVVARCPCSTTVLAGGQAEVSFYPFNDEPVSSAVGYSGTVTSVGPAGTLRLYLRLGELAAPFLDTSGYVNGPSNGARLLGATPYTTHVAGALAGGQDDGAVSFNSSANDGYAIQTTAGALNPSINSAFTLAAWVKPAGAVGSTRGGILSSSGVVAGSPSHEEGWMLEAESSGGIVTAKMSRVINNVRLSASHTLALNTWAFLVGTYDGANLRLYVNAVLAATTADARADSATNYGFPTVDRMIYSSSALQGQFWGIIDECAIWGATLSLANIQTLYAAAF